MLNTIILVIVCLVLGAKFADKVNGVVGKVTGLVGGLIAKVKSLVIKG
jgi:hypothetical protein